jgi:hypothetical protein
LPGGHGERDFLRSFRKYSPEGPAKMTFSPLMGNKILQNGKVFFRFFSTSC